MNKPSFLILYNILAIHLSTPSVIVKQNQLISVSGDNNRLKRSLVYYDEIYLNFTQLTNKYGYPTEQHTVITEDGYVLTLFRILSKCPETVGYPVILMHGIFDSSDVWVFTGPNEGLGYILANNCYDVWAANSRGNAYSRKHTKLNPDRDPQFWDYSFEDSGLYDLPAIIDYVTSRTSRSKVYYIGFSQGTTIFFVMASTKPEYNSKIQLSIQLAPVVWMKYVDPLLSFAASNRVFINNIFKKLGVTELFARHQVTHQIAIVLCQIRPIEMCGSVLNLLTGEKIGNLSPARIINAVGHLFAGTSVKTLNHYAQLVQSQQFQHFDAGVNSNRRRYGVDKAPSYNVSHVTSPVVVMCGRNDLLSDLKNIKILSSKLPKLIESYIVPDPTWSHNDHVWNTNAPKYVHPKILTYFNAYNNL